MDRKPDASITIPVIMRIIWHAPPPPGPSPHADAVWNPLQNLWMESDVALADRILGKDK